MNDWSVIFPPSQRGHQPLATSWQTHVWKCGLWMVRGWEPKRNDIFPKVRRILFAASSCPKSPSFPPFFLTYGVALEKRFMEAHIFHHFELACLERRKIECTKTSEEREEVVGWKISFILPHSFRFSKVISHQSFSCFSPFCTFSWSNWQLKSP